MIITITAVLGTFISVTSVVVGIYLYRRTVYMNIFRTYADKYNSIIIPEIYDKWKAALNSNKHWDELTPHMIQYLNLVWEEYYLFRTGVIPKRLWRLGYLSLKKCLTRTLQRQL